MISEGNGDDTTPVGTGNDMVLNDDPANDATDSVTAGGDFITGLMAEDTIDLDALFDALGVATAAREGGPGASTSGGDATGTDFGATDFSIVLEGDALSVATLLPPIDGGDET